MKQIAWGLIGTATAVWLVVFLVGTDHAPAACSGYAPFSTVIGAMAIASAVTGIYYRGELRFAMFLASVSIALSGYDAVTHGWVF